MTKPTKEEADALRAFIPLLAPLHSPHERATMAMQMEGRIAGRETSLMALSHRQIGALFYPGDAARAAELEQQIAKARASGELATRIPDGKGLLIADLAGWLGCPPISPKSPLRHWLNHLEVLDADSDPESPATEIKKAALVKEHAHHWETIEADLREATRNGLRVAQVRHGYYDERIALDWAERHGKIRRPPTMRSLPSTIHRTKG